MACILRVCLLSCFRPVQIFETLWTTVCQAPPSMGFPRQEYWRGYQGLVQGIFLTQGSTHVSYISCRRWAGSLPLAPPGKPQTLPVCLSVCESCSVVSDSLQLHGLYSPWDSPGQNTGLGSLSLLQGIFRTQGSNPGLPHCRQILYKLSHKGSPF